MKELTEFVLISLFLHFLHSLLFSINLWLNWAQKITTSTSASSGTHVKGLLPYDASHLTVTRSSSSPYEVKVDASQLGVWLLILPAILADRLSVVSR